MELSACAKQEEGSGGGGGVAGDVMGLDKHRGISMQAGTSVLGVAGCTWARVRLWRDGWRRAVQFSCVPTYLTVLEEAFKEHLCL